jgi:hypothetical protein
MRACATRCATRKIGHTREEISKFDILVEAETEELLERVLEEVQQHGAFFSHADAHLEPAPKDGVFPEDFYSTTNLETFVRVHHRWIPVENIEMDCGGTCMARGRAVARGDRADGAS